MADKYKFLNLKRAHSRLIVSGFIIICSIWLIKSPHIEGTSKVPKLCQEVYVNEAKCMFNLNIRRVICLRNIVGGEDQANATAVYLCSWSLSYLDPEEIMKHFPVTQKLTVKNGNVAEFLTDFPRSVHLKQLILVELNIRELRSTLFVYLENLEFLDLSQNCLKRFAPEIIKNQPSLSKIVLTDNPWDCSTDLKWILSKSINSKITNKNLLQCGEGVYAGKPVYFVMSFIKKMEKDCPVDICSCIMNNIVWSTQQSHLIPVITVNCSDRGLTQLPNKLPVNITTLLLHRNNISDLLPLARNKFYRNIADIYLDNNQVETINVLEGALWLKMFRVLSLKGNKLTQVPIYALDNAFEKNRNMAKVYLGRNPWKCDCSFTPDFQNLLIKYRTIIKDENDITCSENKDDENSNLRVNTLSTNSLCRKSHRAINPLDILSAVFGFLILLIVGKLLFDWWMYKRTGKFPWIASKMP